MMEVLEHYRTKSYLLHAFVIMPDHFHILVSPQQALERTMQNIKGGFSFRAKREFAWSSEIWQPGFSDHRIRSMEDWNIHVSYIQTNPLKGRLCNQSEECPYLSTNLDPVPQRLKPGQSETSDGGTKVPPLQAKSASSPII
jgi:putative transposase